MNENINELHCKILKLRKMNDYTQQYVADYLEVDKSTYAHYEAGRRTPDIKKLKKLAELYELEDELLGSKFPFKTRTEYPKEMLDTLQKVIDECKTHSGNYESDKIEFKKLREALEPVLKIRDDALDFQDININNLPVDTTVKRVCLDVRAEALIRKCFEKLSDVMN